MVSTFNTYTSENVGLVHNYRGLMAANRAYDAEWRKLVKEGRELDKIGCQIVLKSARVRITRNFLQILKYLKYITKL